MRHGARLEVERRKATDARVQLREYLDGRRHDFDLRTRPLGTTFQRRAWNALCDIPYGETRSYGGQAKMVGIEGAQRAVGRANGANPIAIVIPCHRVLGASGSMTGFGGGIDTKRWLLALEREGRVPDWTPAERAERRASQAQLGLFA
jgi:methylated-DNA-[protein]-cysteine S-methyltransferase